MSLFFYIYNMLLIHVMLARQKAAALPAQSPGYITLTISTLTPVEVR